MYSKAQEPNDNSLKKDKIILVYGLMTGRHCLNSEKKVLIATIH